ncbi:MAG: AI-2E family transporter [Sulfurovum sp.]|nr:MAG: AI-2E family transporter [Sulfurovum sp.]
MKIKRFLKGKIMEQNLFVKSMIVVSILIFGWLFMPFLKSFIVALLLVISFTPIHLYIEKKLQKYVTFNKERASFYTAILMSLILFSVLFVPIIFFILYIATHPQEIVDMGNTFTHQIRNILSLTPDYFKDIQQYIDILTQKIKENQTQIATFLALNVKNGIFGFFGAIGEIFLIISFFFFISWYRYDISNAINPIIPISKEIKNEFMVDMIATSSAGFYTLIGVAIAQGLVFGIFISFFELYDPWLFGLMVAVFSVIPIVGTALVYVPVALNELFNGNLFNAFIILLFSWASLSFFIDNIVRLLILKKLNYLLTRGRKSIDDFLIFFSIMAGLISFGFWGFLIGPAIVAFVVTLIRVLGRR